MFSSENIIYNCSSTIWM